MKYYDLEERWSKHFEKERQTPPPGKSWIPYKYVIKLPSGNLLMLFMENGIRLHNTVTGDAIFYFDAIGTNKEGKEFDSGLYLELL